MENCAVSLFTEREANKVRMDWRAAIYNQKFDFCDKRALIVTDFYFVSLYYSNNYGIPLIQPKLAYFITF